MQISLDLDGASISTIVTGTALEALPLSDTGTKGITGFGLRANYQSSGRYAAAANLYLAGFDKPDIYVNDSTSGLGWSSSMTLEQSQISGAANLSLDQWRPDVVGFVFGDTQGAKLPLIVANNVGLIYIVSNPQNSPLPITPQTGQTINFATGYTAAATMASSTPLIGVPDNTRFPLNSVVTVSASVNAFTTNTNYYVVLLQSPNQIELSASFSGPPITPTNNSAINLILMSALVPANSASIFMACSYSNIYYWAQK